MANDPFMSGLDAGYTPGQSAAMATMLPPGYTSRLFQVESGNNPNAQNGSHRGLAQFGRNEEKQYGITDPTDPAQQANGVAKEAQTQGQVLSKRLGRAPTPGELYLTHQQGIAGGPAILSADPDTPAWQAVRPFYKTDAQAKTAITGNIPKGSPLYGQDPDKIGAGDFRNFWVSRFEGGMPQPQTASAAPPAPGTVSGPGAPPVGPGAPLGAPTGGLITAGAPPAAAAPGQPAGQPAAAPAPGMLAGLMDPEAEDAKGLAALPAALADTETQSTPMAPAAVAQPTLAMQIARARAMQNDPQMMLRQKLMQALTAQAQPLQMPPA